MSSQTPPRPSRLPPALAPAPADASGSPDPPSRVLVVDDDPAVRRSVARILMTSGFEVSTAENGAAALSLLDAVPADVVLTDLNMPSMDGLALLDSVKRAHPEVEVVMMTAFGQIDDAVKAVRNGAYDFLAKPFASNEVVAMAISKAAERKHLLDRMRVLEEKLEGHETFGELIGSTPKMRELYSLARGVAATSATVLILGESGTGKELIARAIHQGSSRADRPFIAINCSAIPIDLVESELFGHMRGAFTGALATRVGLFEAAHHGTLFLDEIGDLPIPAQVKLLRALQEGEVKKVGSNDTTMVDVRVVAATNVDLKSRIAAGKFREDLYYRLAVVAIRVPPLRQRRDDIPLLAYHFLRKYALRMNRPATRIGVEAMRLLREQKWPGNVRELENAIEHAVVMARGETIVPGDLPSTRQHDQDTETDDNGGASAPLGNAASREMLDAVGRLSDLPYATAKRQALDAFEQAYLEAVLRRTGGNVSEAARQAGLDRSNFRRVLKKTDVRRKQA